MKKKINYPKTRKPRDTSYSVTYQLIKQFGEAELYRIWSINGMYTASKILRKEHDVIASPAVMRYLSYKFNWKREVVDLNQIFIRGVLNGKYPPSFYKQIIIPDSALKKHNVQVDENHME